MLPIGLCLAPYHGGIYRHGENVPTILSLCTIWSTHR